MTPRSAKRATFRRGLGHATGLFVGLLVFLIGSLDAIAADDAGNQAKSVLVSVQDGVLLIDIENAPLEDVLRAISKETGIGLCLEGDLSGPITLTIRRPLVSGLMALIGDRTAVLSFSANDDAQEMPDLATIYVRGPQDGSPTRVYPRAAVGDKREYVPVAEEGDRITRLNELRETARSEEPLAAEDFARVLEHETDVMLRRMALIGLAKIGGPHAYFEVLARTEDKEPLIRYQALRALAGFGVGQSRSQFIEALEDESSIVRLQSVKALGRVADDDIAFRLAATLSEDPDPEVREAAILSVRGVKSDFVRDALNSATLDEDQSVQDAARLVLQAW